jgi:hypothetical protein
MTLSQYQACTAFFRATQPDLTSGKQHASQHNLKQIRTRPDSADHSVEVKTAPWFEWQCPAVQKGRLTNGHLQ